MSLNPWRELREAQETIGRLKRHVEFLRRMMDRKDSYAQELEESMAKQEDEIDRLSKEVIHLSHHLSNVWRTMQEWKPARVVKMYEEDK